MESTGELLEDLLRIDASIRYVAIAGRQPIEMRARENLAGASSSTSDYYEELLVNPALLLLTRQRGELDCGGLRFVVVGYGNFSQLILPLTDGHLSVAFELGTNPLVHLNDLVTVLRKYAFEPPRSLPRA
jgi:hypothetical protein